jgi:uncharacterized protein
MRRIFVFAVPLILSVVMAVLVVDRVVGQKDTKPLRKVLCLTQSAGFEHDVVKRSATNFDELSFTERVLTDICREAGIQVTCTKDSTQLTAEFLQEFDAVFFYTTGDLPIPNRQALLDYVASGKGFVGSHCATDTFHGWEENGKLPYIDMIGAEFLTHHAQELASVRVKNPSFAACTHFPAESFQINDEWYMFKNLNTDMIVDLELDTKSMTQSQYNSVPPYPVSWHRNYGKGRVFYTAMGHRDDVWTNPLFQKHLVAGIEWALGDIQ